ncbi:MAG: hypothetical protein K6E47_16665 [Lachnospiraceae bacterium]|nr:hypothetical protein [Lachnospiraceae bacterium]
MKKILIILLAIIVLYSAYVTVDCIRLRKSASYTPPLITLVENKTENEAKYTGLGYSVVYYVDSHTDEKGNVNIKGHGAEFWLFGSVKVWYWEE